NGRPYRRTGNRSPHVIAAPHGAYRCADDPEWRNMASNDRWIAIACLDEGHWRGLVAEMGGPDWTREPRFASLEARYANEDAAGADRVQGVPGRLSLTPPDVGGRHGRGAPCFGEDNEYVYGEILGLSSRELATLHEADVIEMPEVRTQFRVPSSEFRAAPLGT